MESKTASTLPPAGTRGDKTQVLKAAYKISKVNSVFGRDCGDTYTAGSERHAIFVLLVWVEHAQGHCQLPFAVRYDGKGQ